MLYCLCTFCFATLGALCFATFFGHEGEPLFCFGNKKNEYNFSKEPVYKQFFFLQGRVLWTERALLAILNIGVCHTKSQAERGMEDGGQ